MKRIRDRFVVFGIACFLLLFFSRAVAVSDIDMLFQMGNQHYHAGEFEQAMDVYLSIVNEGVRNANVFFNLANCYLKTGDIGRAVYFYRQAQSINFRDSDIRANLEIARRIVDESGSIYVSPPLYDRLVLFAGRIGTFGLSLVTAVLWMLACGTFLVSHISRNRSLRRRMQRTALFMLILCLSGAFFLGLLIHFTEFVTHAVAVDRPVIARNGPGDHFTGIYEQLPGYEMTVRRKQNGWTEVSLPNGFTGWVPADSVKIL